jgi:hypothetical protein
MTQPTAIVAEDAVRTTSPPVPEGERNPLAPSSGTPDPYLAMIERAARDPSVDLAKLQGLMAMKKEVEADRASIAFAEAFNELQPTLPTIDRKGRIIVYSKADRERAGGVPEGAEPIQKTPYATLDDILEALREPLQHDSSGSKNNVQAVGSSLTYGRRYSLMAVLPIVSHAPQDADDDGKVAGAALIDGEQLIQMQQLLEETKSDLAIFFDTLGATGFSDMTVKQFKRGVALLNEKKRRTAKKAAQP